MNAECMSKYFNYGRMFNFSVSHASNGIAVFDISVMFMEEREREKENMRGDGMEPQRLSEGDLLIACPTVCCFSFKEKMFCM